MYLIETAKGGSQEETYRGLTRTSLFREQKNMQSQMTEPVRRTVFRLEEISKLT